MRGKGPTYLRMLIVRMKTKWGGGMRGKGVDLLEDVDGEDAEEVGQQDEEEKLLCSLLLQQETRYQLLNFQT